MSTRFSPSQLALALRRGLLSFPVTDFDADDRFDEHRFADRVRWLATQGASAVFAAGGAGEFFSLDAEEYSAVVRVTVAERTEGVPVIAATGYGTRDACRLAREAERLGADGLLLLPPYLTEASQVGLAEHVAAVCAATGLGVIVYNRSNLRLRADTLARLAERRPNLIGFKDGVGDFEELLKIRSLLGDRLVCINGMPTAEIYAEAFRGVGIHAYSSAIFNFIPALAMQVFRAFAAEDQVFLDRFKREFLIPYSFLRSRQPGYAVSIVKAGVDAIGRGAGSVRPPLSSLTAGEREELGSLIRRAQVLEQAHG